MFIRKEAIIADMDYFSIDSYKIIQIMGRSKESILYELSLIISLDRALASKVPTDVNIWRQRLDHTHFKLLKGMRKSVFDPSKLKKI